MHANVHIKLLKDGKVVDKREGHNVWVDVGREYLASMICFDSPIQSSNEGSVDLASDFPEFNNETFVIRYGHIAGVVETEVNVGTPVNSAALLATINSQLAGIVATLGGSNGIVFTPTTPTPIEIVWGAALNLLGMVPHYVAPAGMTTSPLENRRIKYMGFGIGGLQQSMPTAFAPPYSTGYPAGADPSTTAGNEYNKEDPRNPLITSLERPVRITGGTTPYPGDPADVWLVQSPKFMNYEAANGVMKFHAILDMTAGDMVYGPYTEVPISEVGLFLSGADVNDAFNVGELVAYYSFGTILLSAGFMAELVWTVSV